MRIDEELERESHCSAIQDMIDQCKRLKGNAILGVRIDSRIANLRQQYKVCAYGTACIVRTKTGSGVNDAGSAEAPI